VKIATLVLAALVWAGSGGAEVPAGTPASADWSKWAQLNSITVGHGYLTDNDVSPDGALALVVSEEEALVRVYDLKTLKPIQRLTVPGFEKYGHLAALFWPIPSDAPAFVSGGEKEFTLRDAKTGAVLQQFGTGPTQRLRLSSDRTLLMRLETTPDRPISTLRFYRIQAPAALTELDAIEIADRVLDWDLNAANELVTYVTVSDQLRCIDRKTKKERWSIASPKYANAVRFSPDGAQVACGGDKLTIVDAETAKTNATRAAFKNNINTIAYAPQGGAVAVSSYDGRVRIIGTDLTMSTLPVLKELKHSGTANVYGLTFFANGKRLLSSSGDKTLRIWGQPEAGAAATAGGK